jgi:two-component system, NtrC family, response regulator AtoC
MKTQTTVKGDTVLHARTTLVFYHRDGAMVAQLDKGKPLVVGRTAPADIEIPDPGLSRRHASFTWDDLGVWIEDLDSTNGTKKNGERVTRALITPIDEISIGPVRVSIHILSSMDEQLRGFDGHDRFVSLLEDEITRARQFQRPLALMMVTGPQGKEGHVSRWASRLRPRLRPVDRVGIYGPSAVMVMLPEPSQEMLHALANELAGDGALTCGVVLFPNDGQSGEELIAALRSRRVDPTTLGPADVTPIVAKNTAMKQVMTTVKRLAQSTIAVLLHGETGTGKEVIARAIHDGGPRKKQVMRCINCAAIPGTLIESVLFGHEQGSFTGADKSAPGMFEQAHGGTILLDEIGELAASAQAALLRVLETKRLMRVGGNKEIEVDVRVIAATHRNLEAMVQAGQFRQDLLYRLNTMTLHIPPLRERTDEIRPLAERFLKEARAQSGSEVKAIDPQAMAALEAYAWPGNVRELRNAIERAVVLAEGKAITLDDLADRIRQRSVPAPEGDASGELPSDYKDHLRKYEAELILRALHKHNGNQTETAKALNLPLRTLVHKIQTYGIKKKFDR